MFRIVFTVYMLTLSLIGPNRCCCAVARFVAVGASWATGGSDSVSVVGCGCCQGKLTCDSDENRDDQAPGKQAACPKGPNKHCQCQKTLDNGLPVEKSELVLKHVHSWMDELTLNFAIPLVREAGDDFAGSAYLDVIRPVTRSGREIRIDIHSWRC